MRKLLFLFLWLTPLFLGAAHQPAMWQTFYKQSFTGRNLSTAPLTVGGLKGDTYDYKVILYKKSTGTNSQIFMRFNGDSGSNYRNYYIEGVSTTVQVGYLNTNTQVPLSFTGTNASYAVADIAEITGKSGGERVVSVCNSMIWGTATRSRQGAYWWWNTADTLTRTASQAYWNHNMREHMMRDYVARIQIEVIHWDNELLESYCKMQAAQQGMTSVEELNALIARGPEALGAAGGRRPMKS